MEYLVQGIFLRQYNFIGVFFLFFFSFLHLLFFSCYSSLWKERSLKKKQPVISSCLQETVIWWHLCICIYLHIHIYVYTWHIWLRQDGRRTSYSSGYVWKAFKRELLCLKGKSCTVFEQIHYVEASRELHKSAEWLSLLKLLALGISHALILYTPNSPVQWIPLCEFRQLGNEAWRDCCAGIV